MYQNIPNFTNYPTNYNGYQNNYPKGQYPTTNNSNDERLIGGFAFPFLLGGVTGAAIAPAFWRPSPYGRPNYYYPPYQQYPYYPYYR